MERYFEIYLNAGDSVAPTVHVNQYDDSETWVFTVYDEDGNVVIPTDASICGVKADGHIILNSASVSDGKVLVDETKQMTAAPGKAVFELLLNGATHGTANFNVIVEHRPGDKSMYSASDISLISDAIARSQMLMNISGLTSAMKTAIINAFNAVGWKDGSGQTYIDAIRDAFAVDPEGGVIIDDALSPTSPNPVENRAVTQAINELKSVVQASLISESAVGNPVIVSDAAEFPFKTLTTKFDPVQDGTGNPSPTNVRPITGFDTVEITRTGKNLLNYIKSRTSYGITFDYNPTTGAVHVSGTATNSSWSDGGMSATTVIPYSRFSAGTYIISGITGQSKARVQAWYDDGTGEILVTTVNGSAQFTLSKPAKIYTRISVASGLTVDETIFPMIRSSSIDDTKFEPYRSDTYTIPLGRTAYFGTLNVVAGELTVSRKLVEFDGSADEDWTYSAGSAYGSRCHLALADAKTDSSRQLVLCNIGVFNSSSNNEGTVFTSGGRLYYYQQSSITSAEEFKTWLGSNTMQVLYELATPITYQLTPTQVDALSGYNIVSSSTDNTVSIEYFADTKLYINKVAAS